MSAPCYIYCNHSACFVRCHVSKVFKTSTHAMARINSIECEVNVLDGEHFGGPQPRYIIMITCIRGN